MKKTILAIFLAVFSSVWAADIVNLEGEWSLRPVSGCDVPACAVTVPGDVHTALLKAKLMSDPYWGCNETNVQWIARADWEFSRSFEVSAAFAARKRIVLEIEDADTFADVYLNGRKLGTLSNRFARWTLDAKKALKVGRNEIRAVFKSAWLESDRRRATLGRTFPMSNVPWAKNQALIRKPACHAGWDWGLAQMTTGFCGPVRLIAHDGPKIDYVYSEQAFNDDLSRCDLTVFADVTESDGREDIHHARGILVRSRLKHNAPRRERGKKVLEVDDTGRLARKLAVHLHHAAQAEVAVTVARVAERTLDRVAGTQHVPADLLLGHEHVLGAGKEVRLRAAEVAVAFADDLKAAARHNGAAAGKIAADGVEDDVVTLHCAEIFGVRVRAHPLDDGSVVPRVDIHKLVFRKIWIARNLLHLRRHVSVLLSVPVAEAPMLLHPALLFGKHLLLLLRLLRLLRLLLCLLRRLRLLWLLRLFWNWRLGLFCW